MDVLILHYHLEPGGVTRIIESQVRAIRQNDENISLRILCGTSSRLPEIKGTEIIQDHRMNYSNEPFSVEQASDSLADLVNLIMPLVSPSTIVHAHNPNLGKNPVLTAAIYYLAGKGISVINHYHDFAEDRPENMNWLKRTLPAFLGEKIDNILYPGFNNYHYIVLNSCDLNRLIEKGINRKQIRLLPNPVSETKISSGNDTSLKEKVRSQLGFQTSALLCTYPVRPIKRKNIGEFILMAALFSGRSDFAITLEPLNPLEIPAYERWKQFCNVRLDNIRFAAARQVNFEELVKASDFCVTTSVREGFGMVFLEPWLSGTPVIGRELSCITNDLAHLGLKFPRLYNEFKVTHSGKTVDFKDLSPDSQEEVIIEAIRNVEFRNELAGMNSFLESWLDPVNEDIIAHNIKVIKQNLSLEEYGKQLLKFYSEVS